MKTRPNILLITSDQQHWNTIGFLNPEIKTPNLDKMAKEGTYFSRAYTVNPTCTPTRASIITGMFPSQHGAWSLGTKLPEDVPTLGTYFKKAGYKTALIGKAHFQQLRDSEDYPSLESNPKQQDLGFWKNFKDDFYGFEHIELARNHGDEPHVGQHYALWMEEQGFKNWRECFRKPAGTSEPQKWKWNIPEKYHYNTWIAERTCSIMESYKNRGENFFMWASFLDPHPPYLAPEPWDSMYDPEKITIPKISEGEHDNNPPHFKKTQEQKPDFSSYDEKDGNICHGFGSHLLDKKILAKNIAVYYGMTSLMDKYIGVIMDKLDKLGLSDNTVVVFTTDHGHFYGHHGLIAKGPFHYEDLVKIPMIVRMPGKVPEGKISKSLQSIADLAPTFLEFCGIEVPRTMTGKSQLDVWTGVKDSARESVIVEDRHQPTTVFHKTYINERYKITVYYGKEYGELFDLESDPGETKNLWDSKEHKNLKSELLLKFIHAEMGNEPIWMPRVAMA
ncbi:MAG TPA: sulfatase-like hydrolase/transferase [Victivallales bacterium]|nr:sulfatase-like hydrolase/transferase [Victivallales bacterium]